MQPALARGLALASGCSAAAAAAGWGPPPQRWRHCQGAVARCRQAATSAGHLARPAAGCHSRQRARWGPAALEQKSLQWAGAAARSSSTTCGTACKPNTAAASLHTVRRMKETSRTGLAATRGGWRCSDWSGRWWRRSRWPCPKQSQISTGMCTFRTTQGSTSRSLFAVRNAHSDITVMPVRRWS